MATDLAKIAKERGIKYFLISYVDLFGTLRAKLAPAAAIGDMAKEGAGFAGGIVSAAVDGIRAARAAARRFAAAR